MTKFLNIGVRMGKTVVFGNFEWDEDKAKKNLKKHKISFEDATRIFFDPLFWEQFDFTDSQGEDRYFGTGTVDGMTIVVSSYVYRGRMRLISARYATPKERKDYGKWRKGRY